MYVAQRGGTQGICVLLAAGTDKGWNTVQYSFVMQLEKWNFAQYSWFSTIATKPWVDIVTLHTFHTSEHGWAEVIQAKIMVINGLYIAQLKATCAGEGCNSYSIHNCYCKVGMEPKVQYSFVVVHYRGNQICRLETEHGMSKHDSIPL